MPASARQRTFNPENLKPLEDWLRTAIGASTLVIARAELLGGGAVQENWRLDVVVDGSARAGANRWVLRTDAAARLPLSLDRASEFFVLQAAHQAGVRVAEPIARCDDAKVIGAPFLVQAFLQGEAQGHLLVKDPALDQWGPQLAATLGEELAKIHAIRKDRGTLTELSPPQKAPGNEEVAKLRAALTTAGDERPALEYILAWLDRNAPEPPAYSTLVHGDFRTGNYLVQEGKLAAILDWEFAHWGDPDEDIGWFCAKCWRFGSNLREGGGIADRRALYEAYEQQTARQINPRRIQYWEVMAAAKWATVAVLQGDRFRKAGENSLELALTGLMASEIELEAFDGLKAYDSSRPETQTKS